MRMLYNTKNHLPHYIMLVLPRHLLFIHFVCLYIFHLECNKLRDITDMRMRKKERHVFVFSSCFPQLRSLQRTLSLSPSLAFAFRKNENTTILSHPKNLFFITAYTGFDCMCGIPHLSRMSISWFTAIVFFFLSDSTSPAYANETPLHIFFRLNLYEKKTKH